MALLSREIYLYNLRNVGGLDGAAAFDFAFCARDFKRELVIIFDADGDGAALFEILRDEERRERV